MPDSKEIAQISEADYTDRTTFPGIRYLFTVMCFLGTLFLIAARVNMSVAMVALVNKTAIFNMTQVTNDCPNLKLNNITDPANTISKTGPYNWPQDMQNLVLNSFYYFFLIMQIPGGRFSEMFGGKWVFVIGLMISLVFTLLVPFAVYNSFHLLLLVRMLTGAAQGVCLPAIFNLMALWFPNTERNLLQNIALSGINVGIFITMMVTGALCNSKSFGWASSFYFIGLLGLLFCLLWIFLVTDTPKDHPFMSAEELEYITSNQTISDDVELPYFPWKRALTSLPLWAVVIAQVGEDWSYYTILNHLPQFFFDILHFELDANSFIASFPYLLKASTAVMSGFLSDLILRRELVSVLFARRFFNTLAGVGSAICLGLAMVAGCNLVAHIVFLTLLMTFSGFCFSGYLLNVMDLTPEFAGTVFGIMNTASTIRGFTLSAITISIVERGVNSFHNNYE
nr:sialin-like [Parasteatoda tepidariorum]